MPTYEYKAWITVRADSLASAEERVNEAEGLLARMTTVALHIEDSPPIDVTEEDDYEESDG